MALPTVNVGDPIIDQSNFHEPTFDYTASRDGLDFNTSADAGARDGKLKSGFYLSNITRYGAVWGSDSPHGPAEINREEQIYCEDPKYPHPSNYKVFSIEDGRLKTFSRPVLATDSAEVAWAKVKGFYVNPDGSNGEFVQNKPVKYVSGMWSTYGRHSMSFGRTITSGSTPYGADGASADINQRSAIFPALKWGLQDVPYGMDVNGENIDGGNTTYMPGKMNAGGIMTELDDDENFGESDRKVHQTTHLHRHGQQTTELTAKTTDIGKLLSVPRISGRDILPTQIAFFVDGIYTHVVPIPPEMSQPMPIYQTVAGEPYKVATTGNDYTPLYQTGNQKHSGGTDRYMQFADISNLARDGKYPRDLARQMFEAGNAMPPHTLECAMYLDYFRAYPLKVDNPDTHGVRLKGVEVETGSTGVFTGIDTVTSITRPVRGAYMELPTAYVKGQTFQWIGHAPDGVDDDSYNYVWTHDFGAKLTDVSDLNQRIVTGKCSVDIPAGTSILHNVGCEANPK